MGIPQESCLDLASIANISSSNPFWIQFLEAQSKITSPKRKNKSKRSRRNIMKRRARMERNRRSSSSSSSSSRSGRNEVVKRVKVLKKLVPNCESTRMETLFQETADYILALQMRVKVMQTMVNVLQLDSDEEY